MRKRDEVALWPVYFDSTKTTAEGRKVPRRLGKPSPSLAMIEKALLSLRLPYRTVPEAVHPRSPWKKTGLILARKVKPKNQILRDIAKELSGLAV